MKEHPILFSAPIVRALLDGSKTQTRRAAKEFAGRDDLDAILKRFPKQAGCPYGQPGDRLWVRETFMDLQGSGVEHRDDGGCRQRYAYVADCPPGSYGDAAREDYGLNWKPSIHMPGSASRIQLEVVSVRVEHLQDISYEYARAEGVDLASWHGIAINGYQALWESINGTGSWDAKP